MTNRSRRPLTVLLGCVLAANLFGGRATPAPAQTQGRLGLTLITTADTPVGLISHPVTRVRYVIEKSGRVRPITDDGRLLDPALDLSQSVSDGNEQGLLGAAFSNDGTWLYVDFTNRAGDTRIRAYRWAKGAAAASGTDLLAVPQPYANHNGGQLLVTRDGVLWIGMGDGGAAGDPDNNAQNRSRLLGKILRILPTPTAAKKYKIPVGNLRGTDGPLGASRDAPEVWAYGLRNPWRYSIDERRTVWIGDVGQGDWEEIDSLPVATNKANFGWRLREGAHAFNGGAKPSGVIEPVYEYSHNDGGCSVIGGFVYRGAKIASLVGTYVFADYCAGDLLGLDAAAPTRATPLGLKVKSPTSFGLDATGELYVTSEDGPVYRIDPV